MVYDEVAEMRLGEAQGEAQPVGGVKGFFTGIPQWNLTIILIVLLGFIYLAWSDEPTKMIGAVAVVLMVWVWLARQEQKGERIIDNMDFMTYGRKDVKEIIKTGDLPMGRIKIFGTKLRHHNQNAFEKSIGYQVHEYDGEISEGFLTMSPTLDSSINKPLTRDWVPLEYSFNPLDRSQANTRDVIPPEIRAQRRIQTYLGAGTQPGKV